MEGQQCVGSQAALQDYGRPTHFPKIGLHYLSLNLLVEATHGQPWQCGSYLHRSACMQRTSVLLYMNMDPILIACIVHCTVSDSCRFGCARAHEIAYADIITTAKCIVQYIMGGLRLNNLRVYNWTEAVIVIRNLD